MIYLNSVRQSLRDTSLPAYERYIQIWEDGRMAVMQAIATERSTPGAVPKDYLPSLKEQRLAELLTELSFFKFRVFDPKQWSDLCEPILKAVESFADSDEMEFSDEGKFPLYDRAKKLIADRVQKLKSNPN